MSDAEVGPVDAQQIESIVRRLLGTADADEFLGRLRPAIRLGHGGQGRSRVGGLPVLDPGTEWPKWQSRPLEFLMVVDLAEVHGFACDALLPATGLLNFFYDAERQPWGFDPNDAGGWSVVLADATAAEHVEAPDGVVTFAEICVQPMQASTAPSWGEPVVSNLWRRDEQAMSAVHEALEAGGWPGAPRHQLGGWPILVQNPIWLEAQLASHGIYVGNPDGYKDPRAVDLGPGAEDWQLLTQIETDDEAGWMWGDVGTLFYVIRREDLARLRFDKVRVVLQCG